MYKLSNSDLWLSAYVFRKGCYGDVIHPDVFKKSLELYAIVKALIT